MSAAHAAVVIGASRGIGLAICRALLEEPALHAVFATYRSEDTASGLMALSDPRLHRQRAEVTDPSSLAGLGDALRAEGLKPDLVIHCAGILHEGELQPEKALRQCTRDRLQRMFLVNSIGPLLAAQALVPLMPRRRRAHFAALSAMVGSIADNRLGGWYGYRASKAALNQFLRTLAVECRRTHPELCVTAIHPGTTDTDLSSPFQGNVRADRLYTPEQSARRILAVVRAGEPEDSGRFMNWDGQPIPY